MTNNLIPGIQLIRLGVGIAYPVFASGIAVHSQEKAVNSKCSFMKSLVPKLSYQSALSQWAVYWSLLMIFGVWEMVTSAMFNFIGINIKDVFPLYYEISTLLLLWLVHPKYCGALYLWEKQFEMEYTKAKLSLNTHYDNILSSVYSKQNKKD